MIFNVVTNSCVVCFENEPLLSSAQMRRTQFKVVDSMKLPRAARFETSTFTEPDMKKIPDSLASELLGQLLVDQNSNG